MANLKEKIEKITEDLTHLEINTVVTKNMTGGKMPTPRHALIDISYVYRDAVQSLNVKLPEGRRLGPAIERISGEGERQYEVDVTSMSVTATGERPRRVLLGSYYYFDMLRELADKISQRYGDMAAEGNLSDEQKAALTLLYRVRDMSDQIKGVFHRFRARVPQESEDFWSNNFTRVEIEEMRPALALTPDELVVIRKAWELIDEEIAFQTVIQLDGDIVTRINPKYANSAGEIIQKIHHDSVTISVSFWGQLVGVVKEFFDSILKVFFR